MITPDERTVGTSGRRNFAGGVPSLYVAEDRDRHWSIRSLRSCASPLPQTRWDRPNRTQPTPKTVDRRRGFVPPGALRFANCRSGREGAQTHDPLDSIPRQGSWPGGGTNTRSSMDGARGKQALANVGTHAHRPDRKNPESIDGRDRGKGENYGPWNPQFRAVECMGGGGAKRLYSRSGPVGSFVPRSTNAARLAQGPRNGSTYLPKKVPTLCSHQRAAV